MDSRLHQLEAFLYDPKKFMLAGAAIITAFLLISNYKQVQFIVRSLKRNKLRTILTSMAIFILVLVVTAIWSILSLLDKMTEEKTKDLKAMVTEKYGARSQLPYSYTRGLADGAARKPSDVRPTDSMPWSFYFGTVEKGKLTLENSMFFFCMEPEKFPTMDEVDKFSPADTAIMFESI